MLLITYYLLILRQYEMLNFSFYVVKRTVEATSMKNRFPD